MYSFAQVLAILWTVVILGLIFLLIVGYVGCLIWAICRRRGEFVLSMFVGLALVPLLLLLGNWTNGLLICAFIVLGPLTYWRRDLTLWLLPMGTLSGAFFLAGFWMVSTLLMFNRVTEKETNRLAAEMRQEQVAGISSAQFLARFGKPATGHPESVDELWFYRANPWYMFGWSQIAVRVDHGKITWVGLDD
jgi:hypothetical protein